MVNLNLFGPRNNNWIAHAPTRAPAFAKTQLEKIKKIAVEAINYIQISFAQINCLHISLVAHILLPFTSLVLGYIFVAATTAVALARSYDFLQVRENLPFKITLTALAIFAAYQAPVTGLITSLIYVGLSASAPLQKFTREYFGNTEMILDTEYTKNSELCTEHFVLTTDPEPSLFDKDLQNLAERFKTNAFCRRWESAKAELLEIRVVGISVNHFNKMKERVCHYCPQVKHLFHPVDFMYSCLEPKTRKTNALFAKTFTQFKFIIRNPVVIAVAGLAAFHLAIASISVWGPVVSGLCLSFNSDFGRNKTWLTRIVFSAFLLAMGLEIPLSVIATCVSAVAFSRIPSLIALRKSFTDYLGIDLSPKNKTETTPPPFFITTMYAEAWAEHKKQFKTWSAALLRSTPTENVGNIN